VAARMCPNCLAMVRPGEIVAHSNNLVCPGCQGPLEISGFSRNLSAVAGLAAGAIVWRISSAHFSQEASALGWILPIVYSYLSFNVVAPLVLILTADLQLKPAEVEPMVHESAAAH
jgi:hypothetical protein